MLPPPPIGGGPPRPSPHQACEQPPWRAPPADVPMFAHESSWHSRCEQRSSRVGRDIRQLIERVANQTTHDPEPNMTDVIDIFWEDHKQARARLESVSKDRSCEVVAEWKLWQMPGCERHATIKEVRQLIVKHQGEVRQWPPMGSEKWFRVKSWKTKRLLATSKQEKTSGQMFALPCREERVKYMAQHAPHHPSPDLWGLQVDFFKDPPDQVHACSPNFDNAISTVAVYDKSSETDMCLRSCWGITLAEYFVLFGKLETWQALYHQWCTGHVIVWAKAQRGQKGGKARRRST